MEQYFPAPLEGAEKILFLANRKITDQRSLAIFHLFAGTKLFRNIFTGFSVDFVALVARIGDLSDSDLLDSIGSTRPTKST